MKNSGNSPWIAVLINIIFPGLGYVYAGERIWFGILFIIGGVADVIWRMTTDVGFKFTPALVVSWAAIWVATTLDVYFLTRDNTDDKTPPRSTDNE